MKPSKIMLTLALTICLCNVINAAPTGLYVGADAGYSKIDTAKKNIFNYGQPVQGDDRVYVDNNTHVVGGLGDRLEIGYNINERFGFNVQYESYAPSNYKLSECSIKDNQCHYSAQAQLKIQEQTLKAIGNFYQTLIGSLQLRLDVGLSFNIQDIEYMAKESSQDFYVETKEENIYEDGAKQYFIVSPVVGIAIERVIFDNYSIGFNYERVFNKLHGKKDSRLFPDLEAIEFEVKYYFN